MSRKESRLKKHLTKEASRRVEKMQKKSSFNPLRKYFLKEAEQRIEASLSKEGMAWGTANRSLHEATINLAWDRYPDVHKRAKAIQEKIESNFGQYLKTREIGGKRRTVPIKAGLFEVDNVDEFDPDNELKTSREPQSTLIMRFLYRRTILPLEGSEEYETARGATERVNALLFKAGFDINEFIADLERLNIPLYPYYHASYLNEKKGGGIKQKQLNSFLAEERNRYSRYPLLFGGIDPSQFYQEHRQKKPLMTRQEITNRKFTNDQIGDIRYASYLLRAIANKVRQGYGLDFGSLYRDIEEQKDKDIRQMKAQGKETVALEDHYNRMWTNIVNEFASGMQVQSTGINLSSLEKTELPGIPNNDYHWGPQIYNNELSYRVGMSVIGNGRNKKSKLSLEELKFALRNCRVPMLNYMISRKKNRSDPEFVRTMTNRYKRNIEPFLDEATVDPDEFLIPDHSTTYSSNGLDSYPIGFGDKIGTMPVLPAMKKLPESAMDPNGSIVYDRDNSNIGRNHLVKNWNVVDNQGNVSEGLGYIFRKYGPLADRALRLLSRYDQPPFANESTPENLAWNAVLKNRTNAEVVYDSIVRYGKNWNTFDQDLSQSLSSELETFWEYAPLLNEEDPNDMELLKFMYDLTSRGIPVSSNAQAMIANQIMTLGNNLDDKHPCKKIIRKYPDQINAVRLINNVFEICKNNILPDNPLRGAITQYRKDGNWQKLAQYMHNQGLIEQKATDQYTKIPQNEFGYYKKFGYQISKMMDFVSSLMYSCCREDLERQGKRDPIPTPERIYGRHYSSSSGKGQGGQIMIGVRYAFEAGLPVDVETEQGQKIMKMLKDEWKRRHDVYQIKGPTQRKTRWHQRMEWQGPRTHVTPEGEEVPLGFQEPLPGTEEIRPEGIDHEVIRVIERLEYFIGHAGSSEGMLKEMRSGTDWYALRDEFLSRYPSLSGALGVIISPINIRFDILELAAKRGMDNVRKQLENEIQKSVELVMEGENRPTEVLSSDKINNEAVALQDKIREMQQEDTRETSSVELFAEEETIKPRVPVTHEEAPPVQEAPEVPPVSEPPVQPQPPTPQPVQPQFEEEEERPFSDMPKPMEQNYINRKEKPKRNLFKQLPEKGMVNRSSVMNKLEKIADEFDRRGISLFADKIDFLLQELGREE